MNVFVVLLQPDSDWDHLADVMGVYSTLERAKERAAFLSVNSVREYRVYSCDLDSDVFLEANHYVK